MGATKTEPILIHFRPAQKRGLARRARQTGRSISEEVREAVNMYLELPPASGAELEALAGEANRSLDRTLRRLDQAIVTADKALKVAGKSR